MPATGTCHLSWLFAATESRDPLLGIYALTAEWHALMDPAAETQAAALKLAWWREEIARLAAGAPLHPITRFLFDQPRAARVDFSPLDAALEACARQLAGTPLERAAELEPHGAALWSNPLMAAAHLARDLYAEAAGGVRRSTAALGAARYLEEAIADYRRNALHGRVLFPVDELLAAGIEDSHLTAATPAEPLRSYLDDLSRRAAALYQAAARELPAPERAPLRHLLVFAALGGRHARRRTPDVGGFRPAELWLAWSTARRALRQESTQ